MKTGPSFTSLLLAGALVPMAAVTARAADPKVEIGASLANATISLEDNNASTVGIPSGGFGLLSPGVYASFFLGPHVAVEPQLAWAWLHSNGFSQHTLNFAGQLDYFVDSTSKASPYVFAAAGVVDISGSNETIKSVAGGAGFRIPVGDRLTFRIDGRFTHFTDGGSSNALMFGLSIGGVLGQR